MNRYREKKIGETTLVTTDHGLWLALKPDQREQLQTLQFTSPELEKALVKKGIIITKESTKTILDATRRKYSHLYQGTSLHIIILTQRCNHRCDYCHSAVVSPNAIGYDMTQETAKTVIDFIFQSPSPEICIEFQGGEPLLNFPVLQYIVEYAEQKNLTENKKLRFDLTTNLTAMTDEILKYLMEHKVALCTSIDGPESIHNKNRFMLGGGGSHKIVTEWIKKINQEYNYPIGALMVTTRDSLPFYKEVIDEYVRLNLPMIRLRQVDRIGYAEHVFEKIGYEPEQYLEFYRNAMEYIVENNIPIKEGMTLLILKKIAGIWENYTDFETPCGAAIGQMAYELNGDIFTCDEGRKFDLFRLGNVREHSYKQILTSEKVCGMIAASTNENLMCDSCAYKPYCGVCPVCNYADTGNLITVLPKDTRCKIHMGMFNYIFDKLLHSRKHREVFTSWLSESIKTKEEIFK